MSPLRLLYSSKDAVPPALRVVKLSNSIDSLKNALRNAQAELQRKQNRTQILAHLIDSLESTLRKALSEPSVSMAQYQQDRDRLDRVKDDLKTVRGEVKSLTESIQKGQKNLKAQELELSRLQVAKPSGRVLKFRRPGDERP
jgi:chromosome segregation ATPase